jgi:hypothetical protein
LLVALVASNACAVSIDSTNFGDELAGGLITVHYSAIFGATPLETGSVTYTLLGNPLTHAGFAPVDPNFTFFVIGETFSATWELVNITAPAPDPLAVYISKVEIDLRPSRGGIFPSLFDNDSLPSTPASLDGVLGVVPSVLSTGPSPTSAVESNTTWPPSLVNLGDMYGIETLTWTGLSMLGPGQSFIWHDDTDLVVPEPSSIAITAVSLAGLLVCGWRRKRSQPPSAPLTQ